MFHISLSLAEPQAFDEEITTCGISHHHHDLIHINILAINGLDDKNFFLGNESDGLGYEALIHPFDLEPKNQLDITSHLVDETTIEEIEHTSPTIPKFHSLVDNDLGLVSGKYDCPIKSMKNDTYPNPFV